MSVADPIVDDKQALYELVLTYCRPCDRDGAFHERAVNPTNGEMSMGEPLTDDLRRRIQRLEDLEQIRKLKARYLNACDLQDAERAKLCFADGPVYIDMGHVGVFKHRDEFAALYKAAGCQPYVLDLHQGANAEIDLIDEHHAKALWGLDYRTINTRDKTVTILSLKYHDEYAKLDGEWKITKSVSEFRTTLHCSYASGQLETLLASKSLAELLNGNAVR